MVVLDTQQFMNAEFVMTVEQYRQSAAGILRAEGHPLWQTHDHLPGLFSFLCFEHNRNLAQTLGTLRTYRSAASDLAIYDGREALRLLER